MQIEGPEHEEGCQPEYTRKKEVVLTGRVHPGETCGSFMMEGFIKFITSQKLVAVELRKRCVFKIIPFTNPDGVIAGNYRVAFSGNDLNRQYANPHPKLHPEVFSVKRLMADSRQQCPDNILAFIDMHAHSRKKNVFMYGPEFPIHDPRYFLARVIPKLLSERSDIFRFYSCRFRVTKSKATTARVVMQREYGVLNSYTLEASFHGFFTEDRETIEFMPSHLYSLGEILSQGLFENLLMTEDHERQTRERKERQKRLAAAKQAGPAKGEESPSKVAGGTKTPDGRRQVKKAMIFDGPNKLAGHEDGVSEASYHEYITSPTMQTESQPVQLNTESQPVRQSLMDRFNLQGRQGRTLAMMSTEIHTEELKIQHQKNEGKTIDEEDVGSSDDQ